MVDVGTGSLVARFEKYLPSKGSELDSLLQLSHFGAVKVDQFGQIVTANSFVTERVGYQPEEITGKPLRLLFPAIELSLAANVFQELVEIIELNESQIEAVSDEGETLVYRAQFINDNRKTPCGFILLYDISESLRQSRSLRYQREMNRVLLDSPADSVVVINENAFVEYANPGALQMLAYLEHEIHTQPIECLISFDASEGNPTLEELVENFRSGELPLAQSTRGEWKNTGGKDVELEIRLSPLRLEKGEKAGVLSLNHLSEAENNSGVSTRSKTHDPLTNLLNRTTFETSLGALLARQSGSDSSHLLAYIELCDYQELREVWGGKKADSMLVDIGGIWSRMAPDGAVCARLGSDKFVFFFPDADQIDVDALAESIVLKFSEQRFHVEERQFALAINLGISLINDSVSNAVEAIFSVAQICSDSRKLGRNRYLVDRHRSDDIAARREQLEWIEKINVALNMEAFELHCQPILAVSPESGEGQFYEVLLRMRDEELGLVLPNTFVPVAEQFGLIGDIDRFVVRKVVELLSRYQHTGISLGVNLSGQTLTDSRFVSWITELLDTHSVDPRSLVVEITETSAITNIEKARDLIDQLRSRGCRVALDDFGRGLSSYTYLKNLPVDFLKIDHQFSQDMEHSNISHSMVRSINHIGHLLGIATIAEGLETKKSVELAREIGVDFIQGYELGRAVPIETVFEPQDDQ